MRQRRRRRREDGLGGNNRGCLLILFCCVFVGSQRTVAETFVLRKREWRVRGGIGIHVHLECVFGVLVAKWNRLSRSLAVGTLENPHELNVTISGHYVFGSQPLFFSSLISLVVLFKS